MSSGTTHALCRVRWRFGSPVSLTAVTRCCCTFAVVVPELSLKFLLAKNLLFLLLSSALVSSASFADEIFFQQKKSQKQSAWNVQTKLSSGIGRYNNIQLPYSYESDVYIDGIVAEGGTIQHTGLLFGGDLQVVSPMDTWQWVNGVYASRIENLSLTEFNGEATYQRLGIETGLKWNYNTKISQFHTGFAFGYQRNDFESISTSHQIRTFYPKVFMGWSPSEIWDFSLYALYGMDATVSYKGTEGAKPLESATASQIQTGFDVGLNLNRDAALVLGTTYDQSDVNIADLYSYENAGLAVTSLDYGAQNFALRTMTFSLGFRTNW